MIDSDARLIVPGLEMQFEQSEQQHEAAVLGMWTFLATEILFFGGLFVTYTAYRHSYLHAWEIGSSHLKEWAGGINTGVLLTSSFFVAMAVRAAHEKRQRALAWFLGLAILLGLAFLGIKATEYYLEYSDHLVPAINFHFDGPYAPHVELFMIYYFFMTLLHAVHMIVGVSLLSYLLHGAIKGRFTSPMPQHHSNAVEIIGLYWHFVDIVWLFLFPLLYLVR